MLGSKADRCQKLNLFRGEVVDVRTEQEILTTLDENGELEGLPFMPEMLQFCGKRFRVYRRADKTCDTIGNAGLRRMKNCVHLQDLRCGGEAHGGCQARCLLFWKEAWLKRPSASSINIKAALSDSRENVTCCTISKLMEKTRQTTPEEASEDVRYSCQATELSRASTPLSPHELGPYVRDLWSRNVSIGEFLRAMLFVAFRKLIRIGGYRIGVWIYDRVHQLTGGFPYPYRQGILKTTPTATLNLQPGELVQVKSQEEILKTVDTRNRNRGLFFDVEMTRFCGGKYRVLQRVEKIINERTGKMIRFSTPPVMLEGVTCRSEVGEGKLFCPRSIYSYWREIWLERVK
jgi:hypothetical protein